MVRLSLLEALFYTLADDVACDVDYPPFDRALMDGYAVRAAETRDPPVDLEVVGQIAAGANFDAVVGPGQAVQINTGAPIPPGVDAVVRVEDTGPGDGTRRSGRAASGKEPLINADERGGRRDAGPIGVDPRLSAVALGSASGAGRSGSIWVRVGAAVEPGTFVTPRATYVRAGAAVLRRGTLITPLEIAVAATAGAATLSVFRRPTVAILVTGDELIDVDRRPVGPQIRNSNEYLLEALVRQAHAEPVRLGTARDDRDAIRERIEAGLQHDVLCITGGVSMGEFDFVPEVLRDLGAEFHVHKIAIKPGRPTLFATIRRGRSAGGKEPLMNADEREWKQEVGPIGVDPCLSAVAFGEAKDSIERLVFALPGNPVSALIGFRFLVAEALARLAGRTPTGSRYVRATTRGAVPAPGHRRGFRPVRAAVTAEGRWEIEPLVWHGSGDPFGLAGANALVTRPAGAPPAAPGDEVEVVLLNLPEP